MTKMVKLGLIGAGNRGQGIFGEYALTMPHRVSFEYVVEPDDYKRNIFCKAHNIDSSKAFSNINDFYNQDLSDIDGVVIATIEDERMEPLFKAMEHNLHILVEKPLATNVQDTIRIYDATKSYDKICIVCHQMRLTPIYKTIKSLIDSGEYGEIINIQHSENVCWDHMAHSFVRGFFNNSSLTPMILAKCCHDMDILTYLVDKPAVKVSSFGSLKYFNKENCPEGAPKFCLDGCKHANTCPYDVMKRYFNEDTDPAYLRQMGMVSSRSELLEKLKTNRFGKCVFQADNDVVDNQTVMIEFEGGITTSFTLCGHNGVERRRTKISMTNGEIVLDGAGSGIKVYKLNPEQTEQIDLPIRGTHGGGDKAIMDNFTQAILDDDHSILLTPITTSLEGHLLSFAAEESRLTNQILNIREFESSNREKIQSPETANA